MKLSFKTVFLIAAIAITVEIFTNVGATEETTIPLKETEQSVTPAKTVDEQTSSQSKIEIEQSTTPIAIESSTSSTSIPAVSVVPAVQSESSVTPKEEIVSKSRANNIKAIDEDEYDEIVSSSSGTKEDDITPEGRLFGIPLLAGKTLLFLKFRRFLPFPLFWFKSANGDILRRENWDHIVAPNDLNFPGIQNVENLQSTDDAIIVPIAVKTTVRETPGNNDGQITKVVDEILIQKSDSSLGRKQQQKILTGNTFKAKKIKNSFFNIPAGQTVSKIIRV